MTDHELPDRDVRDAVGVLSHAVETLGVARGHLYAFHETVGGADLLLQQAVRALEDVGEHEAAAALAARLVGADVVRDLWTYEMVDDFDAGLYAAYVDAERRTAEALGVPPRQHERDLRDDARRWRERAATEVSGDGT